LRSCGLERRLSQLVSGGGQAARGSGAESGDGANAAGGCTSWMSASLPASKTPETWTHACSGQALLVEPGIYAAVQRVEQVGGGGPYSTLWLGACRGPLNGSAGLSVVIGLPVEDETGTAAARVEAGSALLEGDAKVELTHFGSVGGMVEGTVGGWLSDPTKPVPPASVPHFHAQFALCRGPDVVVDGGD